MQVDFVHYTKVVKFIGIRKQLLRRFPCNESGQPCNLIFLIVIRHEVVGIINLYLILNFYIWLEAVKTVANPAMAHYNSRNMIDYGKEK